ncbi:Uncharacterised protein [Serratia entomophila]|uniref:hypothetical protein n=1 Tax=Serratia entomophila TaxID=42906 RepID=UPI0021792BFA|nr:hypothetical protein [Serratia entomophila]CAI1030555.1 Uncharacterised protein [Serratia entomophila]CAI1846270.1 Uncharacterised protein [Serratia entomophila]
MELFKLYGKEIFSVFIALLTWVLNNYFKGKAKLSYGYSHEFTFLLDELVLDQDGNATEDKKWAHTRSLILVNEGRESATKVSIVFNYKPMHINFWPVHHFEEQLEKDKRYIVTFENIPPKDSIRCELLSVNQELPAVLSIRTKECVGKQVNLAPMKTINPTLAKFYILLFFMGIGTITYMVIMLLQWLIVKTG